MPNLVGRVRAGARLDLEGHPTDKFGFIDCSGCTNKSIWFVDRVSHFSVGAKHRPFKSALINRRDRGAWIMQWYYEGVGFSRKHPLCAAPTPHHVHILTVEPCGPATWWVQLPDQVFMQVNPNATPQPVAAYVSVAATNRLTGSRGGRQYALFARNVNKGTPQIQLLRILRQPATTEFPDQEDWEICTDAVTGGLCAPYPNG